MKLDHAPDKVTRANLEAAIEASGVPRANLVWIMSRATASEIVDYRPARHEVLGVRVLILDTLTTSPRGGHLELLSDIPNANSLLPRDTPAS